MYYVLLYVIIKYYYYFSWCISCGNAMIFAEFARTIKLIEYSVLAVYRDMTIVSQLRGIVLIVNIEFNQGIWGVDVARAVLILVVGPLVEYCLK